MSSHQDQSENWVNEARRRLAKSRGKKPETKASQFWALWPEVKLAIEDGQSIKSIRLWLEEEAAVVLTMNTIRTYIRRCRGKDAAQPKSRTSDHGIPARADSFLANRVAKTNPPSGRATIPTFAKPEDQLNIADDPMAIARKALNKPRFDIRKIHNDGDPRGQNLI